MENPSWSGSSSGGKGGGSVYATALCKAWVEESQKADEFEVQAVAALLSTPQQEKSYAACTDSVYDTLHTMDRLASAHDARFATQDDD
jgi:hypothetical protein